MTKTQSTMYIVVGAVLLALGYISFMHAFQAKASVAVTNEYMATSTAASSVYGATVTGDSLIKTGTGSLGSVVITGANTGVINFYNATTSSVLKRTGQPATSTILLASFPASAAAGTYTFDIVYTTGLLVELESGTMATSTITYR